MGHIQQSMVTPVCVLISFACTCSSSSQSKCQCALVTDATMTTGFAVWTMNLDIVPALSWALQLLSVMCVVCVCVGKVLSRDLTQQLNNAIQFLVHCRPLSISMGNAIKYVKLQASHQLSFARQRHSVTPLQFTSVGNAIKYVKLQPSPLAYCLLHFQTTASLSPA